MAAQSNVPSVTAFLEFLNYYAKFISQLCNMRIFLESRYRKMYRFYLLTSVKECFSRCQAYSNVFFLYNAFLV